MASNFLLLFSRLNLSSLSKKKKSNQKIRLSVTEDMKLFEYRKANKGYWDGSKLYKQVVNKAVPILK